MDLLLSLVVCYFVKKLSKYQYFFDVFNTSVICILKKVKQNKPRPYSEVILLLKCISPFIVYEIYSNITFAMKFRVISTEYKNSIFTSYYFHFVKISKVLFSQWGAFVSSSYLLQSLRIEINIFKKQRKLNEQKIICF